MYKPSIHSVVYQIWPRSFYDSNNDGIGDIQGIIAKLDYIQSLGVTTIWLSPVFLSPNHDYGYDVQDYYSIQPEFGTMQDVEQLIKEIHIRNMSILFDLVANHTSHLHQWFQNALVDPKSKYRDYYYFKEGINGNPPNNWISLFGGSAWTPVENEANMYYLSLFTPQQCDLNWDNPDVRQGIYDIMNFWFKKGIDGFRMDVINLIGKEEGLPSHQAHKKGYQFAADKIVSHPKSFDYIDEMYQSVLQQKKGLMVGEGVLVDVEKAERYCGAKSKQLDLMFHFDLALLGCGPLGKYDFRKLYRWSIKDFKKVYFKWQLKAQTHDFYMGNFFSNHDHGRAVSRFGDDKRYHRESATALMVLNFFQRGTPFIYQGEEIGMTNIKLDPKDWKDFEAIHDYQVLQEMMHLPAFIAKWVIQKMTRDQARTPVQWSAEQHAGFSKGEPWFVVNPNHQSINVQAQEDDPNSILNFTRRCISLHLAHECFSYGHFSVLLEHHKHVLAFRRVDTKDVFVIIVNLSKRPSRLEWPSEIFDMTCVLNNYAHVDVSSKRLEPYQALVFHKHFIGQ